MFHHKVFEGKGYITSCNPLVYLLYILGRVSNVTSEAVRENILTWSHKPKSNCIYISLTTSTSCIVKFSVEG